MSTRQFGRFLITAGIGWLADFAVYAALTLNGIATPFWANVTSCLVGATCSWALSVRHVFDKQHQGGMSLLMIYWIYVLATIVFFSALIAALMPTLSALLGQFSHAAPLVAKVVVTVPSMLLNFLVMKKLTSYLRDVVRTASPSSQNKSL
jgi:putative flippase GtrA